MLCPSNVPESYYASVFVPMDAGDFQENCTDSYIILGLLWHYFSDSSPTNVDLGSRCKSTSRQTADAVMQISTLYDYHVLKKV